MPLRQLRGPNDWPRLLRAAPGQRSQCTVAGTRWLEKERRTTCAPLAPGPTFTSSPRPQRCHPLHVRDVLQPADSSRISFSLTGSRNTSWSRKSGSRRRLRWARGPDPRLSLVSSRPPSLDGRGTSSCLPAADPQDASEPEDRNGRSRLVPRLNQAEPDRRGRLKAAFAVAAQVAEAAANRDAELSRLIGEATLVHVPAPTAHDLFGSEDLLREWMTDVRLPGDHALLLVTVQGAEKLGALIPDGDCPPSVWAYRQWFARLANDGASNT